MPEPLILRAAQEPWVRAVGGYLLTHRVLHSLQQRSLARHEAD